MTKKVIHIHPNTPAVEELEALKQEFLSIKNRSHDEQKKFEAVTTQLESIAAANKQD